MDIHPSNVNEVAWTSWLPALGYALAASKGPVLEIGIGHFSTPFLHEYCRGGGRRLVSIESAQDWRMEFKPEYGGTLFHGFSDNLDDYASLAPWGVVFIDNSPGGKARLDPFLAFLDHSDYLVVHDYHRENEEAIKPFLGGVHHKIYDRYQPPTLLASKIHELNS